MDYLRFARGRPTGVQLFGSDPEVFAAAAASVLRTNPDVDFIDINMGCPAAKVIRGGAGSALMRDPPKCGEIVRRVKREAGVPVTAKIRLGWSGGCMNFREVIDELQSADVDAVALHARTKDERYAGAPHYDIVEGLQSNMSVPLLISGDIRSADDAVRAAEATGAAAVMVARGGVGNPHLVKQIDCRFRGGKRLTSPTIAQQADWCLELADLIIAERGEDAAFRKLRGLAPRFVAGGRRCREYRNRLATEIEDREGLVAILSEIRDEMGTEPAHPGGCQAGSPSHPLPRPRVRVRYRSRQGAGGAGARRRRANRRPAIPQPFCPRAAPSAGGVLQIARLFSGGTILSCPPM